MSNPVWIKTKKNFYFDVNAMNRGSTVLDAMWNTNGGVKNGGMVFGIFLGESFVICSLSSLFMQTCLNHALRDFVQNCQTSPIR